MVMRHCAQAANTVVLLRSMINNTTDNHFSLLSAPSCALRSVLQTLPFARPSNPTRPAFSPYVNTMFMFASLITPRMPPRLTPHPSGALASTSPQRPSNLAFPNCHPREREAPALYASRPKKKSKTRATAAPAAAHAIAPSVRLPSSWSCAPLSHSKLATGGSLKTPTNTNTTINASTSISNYRYQYQYTPHPGGGGVAITTDNGRDGAFSPRPGNLARSSSNSITTDSAPARTQTENTYIYILYISRNYRSVDLYKAPLASTPASTSRPTSVRKVT